MRNKVLLMLKDYYKSELQAYNYYGAVHLLTTYTDEEIVKMFEEKNEIAQFMEDFILECLSNKLFTENYFDEEKDVLEVYCEEFDKYPFEFLTEKYYELTNYMADYFMNLGIKSASIDYYKALLEMKKCVDKIKLIISDIYPEMVNGNIRDNFIELKSFFEDGISELKDENFNEYNNALHYYVSNNDYTSIDCLIKEYFELQINHDILCDEVGTFMFKYLCKNIQNINIDKRVKTQLIDEIVKYTNIKIYVFQDYVNTSSNER